MVSVRQLPIGVQPHVPSGSKFPKPAVQYVDGNFGKRLVSSMGNLGDRRLKESARCFVEGMEGVQRDLIVTADKSLGGDSRLKLHVKRPRRLPLSFIDFNLEFHAAGKIDRRLGNPQASPTPPDVNEQRKEEGQNQDPQGGSRFDLVTVTLVDDFNKFHWLQRWYREEVRVRPEAETRNLNDFVRQDGRGNGAACM